MQNGQINDSELEAPPQLIAALKQLPRESVFVPSTIDEALFKTARRRLTKLEKKNVSWFHSIRWSLASASLIVAVALTLVSLRQYNTSKIKGFSREDVNHDGRVDIIDALLLAKKVQSGHVTDLRFDINKDGVVDRRDAERIAVHAVSLEKGGRS